MTLVIIANIFGMLGSLVDIVSGLFKKRGQILASQLVQFSFNAIAYILLGGYAAVFANVLSGVRNVYSFKYPFQTPQKIFFIVLLSTLSLMFNSLGLLGIIPVISTALFTWYMDKDAKTIKKVLIIILVMWMYYNFKVMNYTSCTFNLIAIISNTIGIFRIRKEETI